MNIDGHTKMYCLIGSPVGHSGSPAMYNYSFDRLGINSAYLAYDVPLEKTGEAVAALKLLGCGGFNVTMPCKTEVTKYLDRLSPACELIGASNCVVVEADGTLTGHNTDGLGFVANLRVHGVDVKGAKMVVLGAGGAQRAFQLADGERRLAGRAADDGVDRLHALRRAEGNVQRGLDGARVRHFLTRVGNSLRRGTAGQRHEQGKKQGKTPKYGLHKRSLLSCAREQYSTRKERCRGVSMNSL